MTGEEFRAHRVQAQLSVRSAATNLGVAPSTIQRWEGGAPIPSEAADKMRSLGLQVAEHSDPDMALAHILGRLYGVLEYVAGTEPDTWRMRIAESPAHGFVTLNRQAFQAANAARRDERQIEIEELMARVPATGFPQRLTPEQESQFWVGYYHWGGDQRQQD
jgi:transcriptional regulator with XRE-family HTH domain